MPTRPDTTEPKTFQEALAQMSFSIKDSQEEYNKKITKKLVAAMNDPEAPKIKTIEEFCDWFMPSYFKIATLRLQKPFDPIKLFLGKADIKKQEFYIWYQQHMSNSDDIDKLDAIIIDKHGDGLGDLVWIPYHQPFISCILLPNDGGCFVAFDVFVKYLQTKKLR